MPALLKTTQIQEPSSATVNLTLDTLGNASFAGMPYGASSFLRNRIINGDMRIDQRNAGASVTPTSAQYSVDRWKFFVAQASKLTTQQNAGSVTPPTGFTNYLGITSSSAYSVLTGDYFTLDQSIEGYNTSDLGWGASGALSVTISFWVRSSLTGTFSGGVYNSAANRSYVFTYTISSANTWTYITTTISGDTTGAWLTTNGIGIGLRFNLGGGSTYQTTAGSWQAGNYFATSSSVNVVGTNGATFYITGVQLEVGSVATPFERRQYGQELALCQRYYYTSSQGGSGNSGSGFFGYSTDTSNVYGIASFPVTMRTSPTITLYDDSNTSGTLTFPGVSNGIAATAARITPSGFNQCTGTFTASRAATGRYLASAEL